MSSIKPQSSLEMVAGSLPVDAALTAVAAAAGTPLAALLPVLGKSLAAERHKKRVEATLGEMNSILEKHEVQLDALTDQQYKFINEAVLALLHTTNKSKMDLLRNVVKNSLSASTLPDQEAVFLSRIVRDISTEEAQFLIENFSHERIWFKEKDGAGPDALAVKPSTPQGQMVLGLLTLGLVSTVEETWGDSGFLRFTPLAAKLIALLSKPSS